MLPLDDTLWRDLQPPTFAPSCPARLRELAEAISAGNDTRECFGELTTMCDQWSTYDSTLAAVPHLVEICRRQPPDSIPRIDLLSWIGWCAACIHLNQTDGPQPLKEWYQGALPVARDLIAESLPCTTDSAERGNQIRQLLAAFAACHGNPALAFILYELEAGGLKCDHCHQFIQPLQSSMNPLWKPEQGD